MLLKYSDINLFNDQFCGLNLPLSQNGSPPTNIIEHSGGYEVRMLVPGYHKSDIKISVKESLLKISAEKKQFNDKILHREFVISKFERSFSLPDSINKDSISASCEDGILIVAVPVKGNEQAKSLDIAIQ